MLLPAVALMANPAGLWHAWVMNADRDRVDFRFEVKSGWSGTLINGRDRTPSSSGSFDGSLLRLEFQDWDAVLELKVSGDSMDGTMVRTFRQTRIVREFHARRGPLASPRGAAGGGVSGKWLLDVADDTHSVWRAEFHQSGNAARGVLMPVSGDSGELTGSVTGGQLRLGRFDAIRTILLKVSLGKDGRLHGTLNFNAKTWNVTGRRAGPEGPNPSSYTRMRDPAEPFRFPVAAWNERFRGKPLLVSITGSWCPNCHEEAPFLNELYERYRVRGLQVVALGFEYTGDAERDGRQLRLFAEKHGLKFPVLLAGTTENAAGKLAQLENFGAYPTTILIGRDGLVKAIHAGFDGPGTGSRHSQGKREMTAQVERLLSDRF